MLIVLLCTVFYFAGRHGAESVEMPYAAFQFLHLSVGFPSVAGAVNGINPPRGSEFLSLQIHGFNETTETIPLARFSDRISVILPDGTELKPMLADPMRFVPPMGESTIRAWFQVEEGFSFPEGAILLYEPCEYNTVAAPINSENIL